MYVGAVSTSLHTGGDYTMSLFQTVPFNMDGAKVMANAKDIYLRDPTGPHDNMVPLLGAAVNQPSKYCAANAIFHRNTTDVYTSDGRKYSVSVITINAVVRIEAGDEVLVIYNVDSTIMTRDDGSTYEVGSGIPMEATLQIEERSLIRWSSRTQGFFQRRSGGKALAYERFLNRATEQFGGLFCVTTEDITLLASCLTSAKKSKSTWVNVDHIRKLYDKLFKNP